VGHAVVRDTREALRVARDDRWPRSRTRRRAAARETRPIGPDELDGQRKQQVGSQWIEGVGAIERRRGRDPQRAIDVALRIGVDVVVGRI
jgi:hypothetical protein